MAGMLPGVECARRRRIHQAGGLSDSPSTSAHGSTRRPSFCLYASNHELPLRSISSMHQRSSVNPEYSNEKLADATREAKERLDQRLRVQRKSKSAFNGQQGSINLQNRSRELRELDTEVSGVKKSGPKRFSWAKFGGKSADQQQEECAVCLDQFKEGENLMQLPCAHMFHSRCLVPWLENNPHCPCCRMAF